MSFSDHLSPEEIPKLLLPYQQRWIADKSRIKLYTKSRRIGVSWAEASDRVLSASSSNGENTFYISYEKEMTRTFIEDCADWAKAFKLTCSEIEEDEEIFKDGDEDKAVQVFRIYFNSGFRIEALSSNPRNLRSRQGCIVIDEAAFVEDLAGLMKAAKAMLLWGGSLHIISTYNGIDNEYFELEQAVLARKLPYKRHFTDFNTAISQGLYRRICLVQGKKWTKKSEQAWIDEVLEEFGEDADEELHCIPRESSGAYFGRALVRAVMSREIPVLRLGFKKEFTLQPEHQRRQVVADWCMENLKPVLNRLEPYWKTSYGKDFARDGDLSYLIVGQEMPNLCKRVAFALEMSGVPFSQQEQIQIFVNDRLPRFVGGAHDARGNGQGEAEKMADRYGRYRIHEIQLSQPWYAENMPKYKAALEDKSVILPEDSDLLDDHRCVELVRGIPKVPEGNRKKGSNGKQRHGDGAVACALWIFASENDSEDAMPAMASAEFGCW